MTLSWRASFLLLDRASGSLPLSPADTTDRYLTELGLWRLPSYDPVLLAKLVAGVVQNHPLTPEQVGEMTAVELALYGIDTGESKGDIGTTIARLDAMAKLSLDQKVELQRRLYL